MVYLPGAIVEYFELAKRLGPTWGRVYLVATGLGIACLLLAACWAVAVLWRNTRKKRRLRRERDKLPSELSEAERQQQIRDNLAAVKQIGQEPEVGPEIRQQFDPLVAEVEKKWASNKLEIVAFGTVSSGKSSLLNALAGKECFTTDPRGGTTIRRNEIPWPGTDQVVLVDTPGLAEIAGAEHVAESAEAAKDADLVLLVVDGPMRESESKLLSQLGKMEKRTVVCLNKEDWYDDHDRRMLLSQLQKQVLGIVPDGDIIAVRSRPSQRTRQRVLADGRQVAEQIDVDVDLSSLGRRLMEIVDSDGPDLLLANLLLQSRGMIAEARASVREQLDRRAWEIVNSYTWGASGAAALSPFPLVDVAAGCAISTKMVLDLARVYRQDIDANVAVKLLGQLGKNLIAILGVSAVTPIASTLAASFIKTIPGIGTIAGGALQAVVMAIVTRWLGAVFIEYFRNEMQRPEGGLAGLARRKWEEMTTVATIRQLVIEAAGRFGQDRQESTPEDSP